MAALNFPSSGLVANVTTYTGNGKTWLWDGFGFDSDAGMTSTGDGNLKFYTNNVYAGGPITGSQNWDINITGSDGSVAWTNVSGRPIEFLVLLMIVGTSHLVVVSRDLRDLPQEMQRLYRTTLVAQMVQRTPLVGSLDLTHLLIRVQQ